MADTVNRIRPVYFMIGTMRYVFTTFAGASRKWCDYRDAHNLPASRSPSVTIHAGNGKCLAYVSYNGRVWEGSRGANWTPNSPLLFDPASALPEEKFEPAAFAVSVGTMSSGFKLYGPFPNQGAAMTFAQSQAFDAWETVPLSSPAN